jgi:hypothetical protein
MRLSVRFLTHRTIQGCDLCRSRWSSEMIRPRIATWVGVMKVTGRALTSFMPDACASSLSLDAGWCGTLATCRNCALGLTLLCVSGSRKGASQ